MVPRGVRGRSRAERPYRPSPVSERFQRDWLQARYLPASVDGPEQDSHLVTNRRVGLIRERFQDAAEIIDGTMDGDSAKGRLQGLEFAALDADGGMERSAPARWTAADGIGHEAQRLSSDVPDQLAF